jgi:hypothetical protein
VAKVRLTIEVEDVDKMMKVLATGNTMEKVLGFGSAMGIFIEDKSMPKANAIATFLRLGITVISRTEL